jgi:hypothetical protein
MPKRRKQLTNRDVSALGLYDMDNANPNQNSASNTQKKLYLKSIGEERRRAKSFLDSNFSKLIPGED